MIEKKIEIRSTLTSKHLKRLVETALQVIEIMLYVHTEKARTILTPLCSYLEKLDFL